VRNVFFRNDGKTKLETVLVRVRKKRQQLKRREPEYAA
jgi:hypothetical protein